MRKVIDDGPDAFYIPCILQCVIAFLDGRGTCYFSAHQILRNTSYSHFKADWHCTKNLVQKCKAKWADFIAPSKKRRKKRKKSKGFTLDVLKVVDQCASLIEESTGISINTVQDSDNDIKVQFKKAISQNCKLRQNLIGKVHKEKHELILEKLTRAQENEKAHLSHIESLEMEREKASRDHRVQIRSFTRELTLLKQFNLRLETENRRLLEEEETSKDEILKKEAMIIELKARFEAKLQEDLGVSIARATSSSTDAPPPLPAPPSPSVTSTTDSLASSSSAAAEVDIAVENGVEPDSSGFDAGDTNEIDMLQQEVEAESESDVLIFADSTNVRDIPLAYQKVCSLCDDKFHQNAFEGEICDGCSYIFRKVLGNKEGICQKIKDMDAIRIVEAGTEEAMNIAGRMLFDNKESKISSFYDDKLQIAITTKQNMIFMNKIKKNLGGIAGSYAFAKKYLGMKSSNISTAVVYEEKGNFHCDFSIIFIEDNIHYEKNFLPLVLTTTCNTCYGRNTTGEGYTWSSGLYNPPMNNDAFKGGYFGKTKDGKIINGYAWEAGANKADKMKLVDMTEAISIKIMEEWRKIYPDWYENLQQNTQLYWNANENIPFTTKRVGISNRHLVHPDKLESGYPELIYFFGENQIHMDDFPEDHEFHFNVWSGLISFELGTKAALMTIGRNCLHNAGHTTMPTVFGESNHSLIPRVAFTFCARPALGGILAKELSEKVTQAGYLTEIGNRKESSPTKKSEAVITSIVKEKLSQTQEGKVILDKYFPVVGNKRKKSSRQTKKTKRQKLG